MPTSTSTLHLHRRPPSTMRSTRTLPGRRPDRWPPRPARRRSWQHWARRTLQRTPRCNLRCGSSRRACPAPCEPSSLSLSQPPPPCHPIPRGRCCAGGAALAADAVAPDVHGRDGRRRSGRGRL
eukprot:scaffold131003_cov54-Phaeocystis_antarctica.AAC.2